MSQEFLGQKCPVCKAQAKTWPNGRGEIIVICNDDSCNFGAIWKGDHYELHRNGIVLKGYAAFPGTGPAGMQCHQCVHYIHKKSRRKNTSTTYRKCWLKRKHWTLDNSTDIFARTPACKHFESHYELPREVDYLQLGVFA